jgi:hypothetical protein
VSESGSLPQREAAISLGADFVLSEGYYNFNAERGYATIEEFAQNGTPVYIVGGWCSLLQTGHKNIAVLRRYIREGSVFRENAAAAVGL